MKVWKKISQIGIINSMRLNWRYFGWGVIHAYILASKNVRIDRCAGRIEVLGQPRMGCIKLGFSRVGICDYKYERTIWNNTGKIVIKDTVDFGQGTRIVNSGELFIGKNLMIKANSSVICHKKISFGDNVLVSWDTLLMDTDHHTIYNLDLPEQQINPPSEIVIGNHVWIGCRCLILKGTTVADDCVIAAGAVITGKNDKKNCVLGVNHTIIRNDINWGY